MALADAGISMKDLVGAVAVGVIDQQVVLDLNYEEEALPDIDVADIPIAMIPSTNQFTLLQMDGKVNRSDLIRALELGKKAMSKIIDIQRKALKQKFEVE
jgi:exosome complex component RRP41